MKETENCFELAGGSNYRGFGVTDCKITEKITENLSFCYLIFIRLNLFYLLQFFLHIPGPVRAELLVI